MADTVSHTISMARSASASAYFASSCASGHAAPMRYGAPSRSMGSSWYISSVTNGMMGCSRRSAWSSTNTRLRWHARRSAGSAPAPRRAFENSMYQSQNSFQKNAYSSRVASPNSKPSNAASRRATRPAKREKIQRSAGVEGAGSPGS